MLPAVTDESFRTAMASFASGVTVVTTIDSRGRPFGLTATAFCSVSRDPPMCLVCVANDADPYPALKETGRFAVNVLASEQRELSVKFSTHGIDKFDGIAWSPGPETGCALLSGVVVSVECVVEHRLVAGDHEIFVGAIRRVHLGSATEPLVYFRGRYSDVVAR
jgi:flavin reductase (DIM6/NTAB) family NADH-FMN oxidoreductase RutF